MNKIVGLFFISLTYFLRDITFQGYFLRNIKITSQGMLNFFLVKDQYKFMFSAPKYVIMNFMVNHPGPPECKANALPTGLRLLNKRSFVYRYTIYLKLSIPKSP